MSQVYSINEKSRSALTSEAFSMLLSSLDGDRDRAGEKYEQIRRGLSYFFQARGCTFAEDHADETINRVARKLGEGEEIRDVYTYVYGVARLIVLEVFKQREKERLSVVHLTPSQQDVAFDQEDHVRSEARLDCLRKCLGSLSVETRNFITRYYVGHKRSKIENRKKLAEELAIPMNALRLRARRVRERLEACLRECLGH